MLRKEKIITMEREKQEAWELAKQLVQIDSSDPGAYEEEIGLWITDWFRETDRRLWGPAGRPDPCKPSGSSARTL